MTKGVKGAPPTKSDMSSPVKAGGGTMQKYSPYPRRRKMNVTNRRLSN